MSLATTTTVYFIRLSSLREVPYLPLCEEVNTVLGK